MTACRETFSIDSHKRFSENIYCSTRNAQARIYCCVKSSRDSRTHQTWRTATARDTLTLQQGIDRKEKKTPTTIIPENQCKWPRFQMHQYSCPCENIWTSTMHLSCRECLCGGIRIGMPVQRGANVLMHVDLNLSQWVHTSISSQGDI